MKNRVLKQNMNAEQYEWLTNIQVEYPFFVDSLTEVERNVIFYSAMNRQYDTIDKTILNKIGEKFIDYQKLNKHKNI